MGLIAVGGQKDYELKFTNTAPCGVDVEFREVKDHLEAIVDDDDSVEQETVAASTVADTFVIDHDTCCLEFDPPSLRVPAKAQGSFSYDARRASDRNACGPSWRAHVIERHRNT